MRRFDPGPRLQFLLNKTNHFNMLSVFQQASASVSFLHSIVVNWRKSEEIGEGGAPKSDRTCSSFGAPARPGEKKSGAALVLIESLRTLERRLQPSGSIGLKLGILGTVLFFIIFLYALRKVIPWLGHWGTARHWMDFHVIAGATAPIVIAFHAPFKFQGIAGFSFWIMVAVALSGFIGRYLYSQIPRSLTAAELSLNELQTTAKDLTSALLAQSVYSPEQLMKAMRAPSKEHIRKIGALGAILQMILLDLGRPFRVARLRRASSGFGGKVLTFGGLLSTGNPEIEQIVWQVCNLSS